MGYEKNGLTQLVAILSCDLNEKVETEAHNLLVRLSNSFTFTLLRLIASSI